MIEQLTNVLDDEGNPAGGHACGTGFAIDWQAGPLVVDGQRYEPNGAFVEDILTVCLRRLEHYQSTKFKCRQNALAVTHIEEALHWLADRTAERQRRGVEGSLQQ